MNSFNVYGQTEKVIGGNTPVWLGTVKPIPVGGVLSGHTDKDVCAGYPMKQESDGTWSQSLTFSDAEGYLYNDVAREDRLLPATCAIVKYHPEGLLIDRVGVEFSEEQIATLQKNIPGVLLVRG